MYNEKKKKKVQVRQMADELADLKQKVERLKNNLESTSLDEKELIELSIRLDKLIKSMLTENNG
jgi:TolA-binding protein